jgi:hypothetical protein
MNGNNLPSLRKNSAHVLRALGGSSIGGAAVLERTRDTIFQAEKRSREQMIQCTVKVTPSKYENHEGKGGSDDVL